MRIRVLSQVLLMVLTLAGEAQEVYTYSGLVKNEVGEPQIGVQFIEPLENKTIALSNDDGDFIFTSSSKMVIARHIGYEDATLS